MSTSLSFVSAAVGASGLLSVSASVSGGMLSLSAFGLVAGDVGDVGAGDVGDVGELAEAPAVRVDVSSETIVLDGHACRVGWKSVRVRVLRETAPCEVVGMLSESCRCVGAVFVQ